MASYKLLASSNSRNSDLSRGSSSSSSSASLLESQFLSNHLRNNDIPTRNRSHSRSSMTVDGLLGNGYDSNPTESSILLDAQITLVDSHNPSSLPMNTTTTTTTTTTTNSSAVIDSNHNTSSGAAPKTVDDVWREIVSGERKELKEEVADEFITLEDYLLRTGVMPVEDVKLPQTERLSGGIFSFDPIPASTFQALDKVEGSIIGFANGVDLIGSGGSGGRGKRGRAALEPLDKAAEQRQRRMIKNRESAARSRERKQAYQVELESLAVRLEEEKERLLREKAERTKERFEQLMEKVIPVVEKRRPPRVIRRVNSMKW
ncbi:G-box-binding factor 4-like [Cucurbita pepo subsp. pepo]|uniref:G-box-binding factor 4-like n=1 Tax=Cucurbita pepo subsp. pepo TaxID=3664 RepID=UPI000C9D2AEC|nr:G-box-binding factor 4-like [Cucurbita pepo subsp. pepo]